MPVVINQTTFHFYWQITTSLFRVKANLHTYLSLLTISLKVALVNACLLLWNTNAIFQISIPNFVTYPKHSKIIFVQAPYSTCCEEVFFFPMWNMLFGSRFIIFREGMWTKPISYQTDPSLSKMTWFESKKKYPS